MYASASASLRTQSSTAREKQEEVGEGLATRRQMQARRKKKKSGASKNGKKKMMMTMLVRVSLRLFESHPPIRSITPVRQYTSERAGVLPLLVPPVRLQSDHRPDPQSQRKFRLRWYLYMNRPAHPECKTKQENATPRRSKRRFFPPSYHVCCS